MTMIKIVKKSYTFELSDGFFTLFTPGGGKIAMFPLAGRLVLSNGTVCEASGVPTLENDTMILRYEQLPAPLDEAALTVFFGDDEIIAQFRASGTDDFGVYEFEYFRKGNKGMSMKDCEFRFSPQPRNTFGHGTSLYKAPCSASINGGYFAPAPFMFVCGNRFGKLSFSLLEVPNSTEIRMSEKDGILAERPGGHLLTKSYHPPKLMITFPKDEWDALDLYYHKLKEKELIHPIPAESRQMPDWWNRFVVDSYGDQITQLQYNPNTDDDWDSPEFTTAWLYRWLDTAEKRLGRTDFNIVVDAFWQHRWSIDPYPDKNRFADLREFINHAHRQGHKVIVWTIPFTTDVRHHLTDTEKTLAQAYGVRKCGRDGTDPLDNNCSATVDYTHDNIPAYMEEYCRILFGNGSDCLDADGIKLDGPFCVSNPADVGAYAHPEKGIGANELLLYYNLFTQYARKVKPDVLLNTSCANPFFENLTYVHRLGDQSVRSEREDRARITSLISPNTLMDSDAVLNSAYIKEDYLTAVVYAVPYLYFTDEFMIGERPSDETMAALGRLLSLAEKKPWGRPIFESLGNWHWESNGRITAACFDANTVMVFSGEGICYVFSWASGEQTLPLFGWKLPADPAATEITLTLTAGEILTFRYV